MLVEMAIALVTTARIIIISATIFSLLVDIPGASLSIGNKRKLDKGSFFFSLSVLLIGNRRKLNRIYMTKID